MDKIYNYEQYLGMSLDFSVIVNSTLDLKPGSILCIDNEDIEKLCRKARRVPEKFQEYVNNYPSSSDS